VGYQALKLGLVVDIPLSPRCQTSPGLVISKSSPESPIRSFERVHAVLADDVAGPAYTRIRLGGGLKSVHPLKLIGIREKVISVTSY
jgi:hypothetical protein